MHRIVPLIPLWVLFAGCLSTPEVQKPFAEFETEIVDKAFPNLTVGLVHTKNTKTTLQYADKSNRYYSGGILKSPHVEAHILSVPDRLGRYFGKIVAHESVESAKAAGVDVIALLDTTAYFPDDVRKVAWSEFQIMFVRPDRTKVDVVGGRGEAVKGDVPGFSMGPKKIPRMIAKASQDALTEMERALRKSQKLATLQAEKTGLQVQPAIKGVAEEMILSGIDKPSYRLPEVAENYALVIGIENYKELPRADFATRDARAVRNHLEALGFPVRNTVFLNDSQASRSDIEKYVESWLPRNVKKGGRVLVYFSGHGAPEPNTGKAYLMPWNGDARFLENTGYPVATLYKKLAKLPAKEILVALDACFSGVGGRSVLAAGTRPLITKVDVGLAASRGLSILSASAVDEITGTKDGEGHGIFTYYFLKGLNGAAKDATGRITAESLYHYLKPKVQDDARRQNRDQTPDYQAPPNGPFVLRDK